MWVLVLNFIDSLSFFSNEEMKASGKKMNIEDHEVLLLF